MTWILVGIGALVLLGAVGSVRYLYRQVRVREEGLERSESRYRALFEESVVGTVVTDFEGTIVSANAAFARMLGYDRPDELTGSDAHRLYVNPSDREIVLGRLREDGSMLMDELLVRHRAGHPLWLMTSSVLLRDPLDGTERILATCLDVTERKELESRVARKGRMEAMGQLAGGIAHDFNNLLTAIQGNAVLLAEDLRLRGTADPAVVEEILESSRTASELTEQLLAFSRGDPTRGRSVDLAQLVRRTRGLLERLLPENIEIATDLAATEVTVRAPPAQLEQVLLNLVLNARDAMPRGGHLRIAVGPVSVASNGTSARLEIPPGPYVCLTVQDDGGGIAPEIRPRLFEPFFTTKTKIGGTGMGLATVYGIVTRAGGAIDVESVPGQGSTFHVLLPFAEGDAARWTPADADEAVDGPRDAVVLLVEDDDLVRNVAARILRRGGYRVLEAPRPTKALEIIESGEAVDLLLTDVVMPDMSGVELVHRVREDRPGMPVLFVSGYSSDMLDDDDLGVGAASLTKPFGPDELLATVRYLLETSRD